MYTTKTDLRENKAIMLINIEICLSGLVQVQIELCAVGHQVSSHRVTDSDNV